MLVWCQNNINTHHRQLLELLYYRMPVYTLVNEIKVWEWKHCTRASCSDNNENAPWSQYPWITTALHFITGFNRLYFYILLENKGHAHPRIPTFKEVLYWDAIFQHRYCTFKMEDALVLLTFRIGWTTFSLNFLDTVIFSVIPRSSVRNGKLVAIISLTFEP